MDWREGILDSYTEDIELTPASNSAKQILLGFNKRDRLQYFSIKRKIYLTQQLGEKEDFTSGHRIYSQDKILPVHHTSLYNGLALTYNGLALAV